MKTCTAETSPLTLASVPGLVYRVNYLLRSA